MAAIVTVYRQVSGALELVFIGRNSAEDHVEVLSPSVAISLAQRIMETFRSPAVSSPQPSGATSTNTSGASNSPKPAPQST